MRLSKRTVAALGGGIMAITLTAGVLTANADSIPTLGPYGQPPSSNQLPMNLPAPAPAPSSPAWVRPYSTGDGGIGAMGGYRAPGGTSVGGNVYVPHSGPPSGGVLVTIPTR
jgi:hypothetical protein